MAVSSVPAGHLAQPVIDRVICLTPTALPVNRTAQVMPKEVRMCALHRLRGVRVLGLMLVLLLVSAALAAPSLSRVASRRQWCGRRLPGFT